jgi:hypothetical protein
MYHHAKVTVRFPKDSHAFGSRDLPGTVSRTIARHVRTHYLYTATATHRLPPHDRTSVLIIPASPRLAWRDAGFDA